MVELSEDKVVCEVSARLALEDSGHDCELDTVREVRGRDLVVEHKVETRVTEGLDTPLLPKVGTRRRTRISFT